MIYVAVTQNVHIDAGYGERRDTLDQRWTSFLLECGIIPVLIPNHLDAVKKLLEVIRIKGVILTGGNDLFDYGGNAKERDETEQFLMDLSVSRKMPVMGVCRGMQMIQNYFGVPLEKVEGHIAQVQTITIGKKRFKTNSYHRWGTTSSTRELIVWATADDGVVKAVRHETYPMCAIMWHPERKNPFNLFDKDFFTWFFSKSDEHRSNFDYSSLF